MINGKRKTHNAFFSLLTIFCITLFMGFIPVKECYAAGLTLSDVKLNNTTALVQSPDPASNPDIPLNGNFAITFSNTVQGYYDGSAKNPPYIVDNRSKVKLERIVDGSRSQVEVAVGEGSPLTVTYSVYGDLIPGSQYVLTLQGDITANNNRNTLGADTEIGFTTVAPQKPAAPSFTSATLLGDVLTLSGLPSNAANLEYRISADGTEAGYGGWSDLAVVNRTATLTATGLTVEQSTIEVRVKASPDTNTPAGDSAAQTIVQGIPPAPEAPSVGGAILSGTQITLTGLPDNASNLEYRIAVNGTDYTDWHDLEVDGTTAVIDASSYDIDTSISKLAFRVKADPAFGTPAGDITEEPVVLALNVETPIQQGKTYIFESGLKLYAEALMGGNTVTVSDAKNKTKPWEVAIRPATPADLGPVYGVLLKGPAAPGKKVILTVPIPYDVIPEQYLDKCSVYDGRIQTYPEGVDEQGNIEPWTFLNDVDRSEMGSGIFKLTCDDDDFSTDGRFHMYSVMYDYFIPDTTDMGTDGYVLDDQGNYGIKITEESKDQGSGIGCWEIWRDDVLIKRIGEIKAYKKMDWRNGDFTYYDYDVVYGQSYSYKIKSYDPYGNTRGDAGGDPFSHSAFVLAMKHEEIVQRVKDDIEKNDPQVFLFAEGDSKDQVTQDFYARYVPGDPALKKGYGANIGWESDRPDLVITENVTPFRVFMPLDSDEAVVNLTGTIKRGKVTVTVTVPITVKWTEEYKLCSSLDQFGGHEGDAERQKNELLTAIARPDVKTIIFNNRFSPSGVIDFQGKTVKAGSGFDELESTYPKTEGDYMFVNMEDGDIVQNVKVDANGKKLQAVMRTNGDCGIENVEFAGMSRTKYAIMSNCRSGATIRNCSFTPAERAGVFLYDFPTTNPLYLGSQTIENCTFDGQGSPGYAVLAQWGTPTIRNCEIKDYKGELTTGYNSSNDDPGQLITDHYTGLHDGFTSAGIFVRDKANVELHGNNIYNCDSGIRVWTGESYKYYDDETVKGPETVYATVDGVEIKDQNTAAAAETALKLDNVLSGNSWDVDICIAADPDNPLPLVRENYGPFGIYKQSPAPFAKGVALDSVIEFCFSKEMNADTINNGTVLLSKDGQALAANVTYEAAEKKVVLTPQAKLGYGAQYTVTVSTAVADKDGNHLSADCIWSFTTTPSVIFYSPPDGVESYEIDTDAELTLGFVNPIDPASISDGADVILEQIGTLGNPTAGGAKAACSYRFNGDGTELVITPDQELANGGHYKITVPSKLTDKQGNALGADAGVEFYTKPAVIPAQFSLVLDETGSPAVEKLQPGKRYVFSIQPINMSDREHSHARTYIVARGGKGARLEHGGDILGKGYFNTAANSTANPTHVFGKESIVFTVPEDVAGNVYVDVMLRETTRERDNPRVLAKTMHFELQVTREEV
ncbi:Ig-like domain-containing protein [Pelotomaculum terephthalicicum JT]|uniref:Ig-like domain-containing protein n=1 Tax=Pelotomaculum TaxID=191373 RepID=UPI0009C524C8|nr:MULTISPECIES: Ig-like domain-containing protein [Pelotomaculum]MCG9968814.1 Ig-like domain-containing protein [Pelotomaculum terephthalicicum JT]OPX89763.1 MAG: hypothetical protein A4E54_00842 [Pelotomaculum sp. PtaB.Bin117]